jgi:hypothetical protein
MAHPRFARQARAGLAWFLVSLALLQLGMTVALEGWLPEVLDPEYTAKEERLRARLAESPGGPLVLMLGSSRTRLGLQAGRLSAPPGAPGAVVFNFGLFGGGPMAELTCLRRLLAAGIRPDLVFVEVMPPLLSDQESRPQEEAMLDGSRLTTAELAALLPYYRQPHRLLKRWALSRCLPWVRHQPELRSRLALDPDDPWTGPAEAPRRMDGHGWQAFIVAVTPELRRRYTDLARSQYEGGCQNAQLAEGPVRVLNDLLDLCRSEGIAAALVLMPEGSEFRAMYTPATLAGVNAFLAGLSRQRHVPVIDARHWVGDAGFWDAHHLLPDGAAAFTRRFEREALRPLLATLSGAGSPPPPGKPRPAFRLVSRGPSEQAPGTAVTPVPDKTEPSHLP